MSYLGRGVDKISNIETLDNITFNGASSYTLQKGGVNFVPTSAAAILISIDGVVQSGNFTVSSSKRFINIAVSVNSGYGYGALGGQTIRTISAGDTVCLFVYGSEGIGVPDENVQLVLYKMIE